MKFLQAIVASGIFTLVLCILYVVHIRYFAVDVVFYSALLDVLLAVVLTVLALFLLRFFAVFSFFEVAQLVLIWLLAGYALAISVPTVLDRSLSFYLLEKLNQRGGGIRMESLEEVFTDEYVKEHRLIDVRVTEQLESGTIVIRQGCVRLTPRGQKLAMFSRFFRLHLLPERRLLLDEYSDDLTDPFRNSSTEKGYEC
tara:strand:- start:63371 stop:63964 length:594 start_codon:yes stop_codon:yes gene_type:complete